MTTNFIYGRFVVYTPQQRYTLKLSIVSYQMAGLQVKTNMLCYNIKRIHSPWGIECFDSVDCED